MCREDSAIGDLRNKFAKIERTERHQAFLRRKYPQKPTVVPCCRGQGCGLTYLETTLYEIAEVKLSKRQNNGLWCISCLPTEAKLELIDIMVRQGIRYDAGEHGDE